MCDTHKPCWKANVLFLDCVHSEERRVGPVTLVLETGKRLRAKAQGIIGPQHRDSGAEQTPARRMVGWWGGASGIGECAPRVPPASLRCVLDEAGQH